MCVTKKLKQFVALSSFIIAIALFFVAGTAAIFIIMRGEQGDRRVLLPLVVKPSLIDFQEVDEGEHERILRSRRYFDEKEWSELFYNYEHLVELLKLFQTCFEWPNYYFSPDDLLFNMTNRRGAKNCQHNFSHPIDNGGGGMCYYLGEGGKDRVGSRPPFSRPICTQGRDRGERSMLGTRKIVVVVIMFVDYS